jgi:hypothetical protein
MSLNLGIIASSRGAAAPPVGLLLDTYPGAAAAYSLRKLRTLYTGSAIRVSRDSDSAQTNIGFDGSGNLDTSALASFVLGSNGRVVTWYDQSGNGRNATTTSPPFIRLNGTTYTLNGKPSLFWTNGQNQYLNTSFTAISQPISTFSVCKLSSASSINSSVLYDSNSTNGFVLLQNGTTESPNNTFVITAGNSQSIEASNTNTNLNSAYYNGANSYVYVNNVIKVNNANVGTNSLGGITIGNVRLPAFYNIYDWSGYISEIIFYPSNQIGNNSAINSNINTYYSIY